MNRTLGIVGALVTGAAVLAFAVSMVVDFFTPTLFASCFASCFASMYLAIGYVTFTAALAGHNSDGQRRGQALQPLPSALFMHCWCCWSTMRSAPLCA